MRKLLIILSLSLIFLSSVTALFSQKARVDCKSNRGWCAATYRELTVGQSAYSDMVRVLGKPLLSAPEADQDAPIIFIWHDYGKIKGNLSGRLAVITDKRTNKIVRITITPDEMTKKDAIEFFGQDYMEMGYEFCEGFENDTAAPVYENPKATEIRSIEYRTRGISISIGFREIVNEIIFAAEPTGLASKNDCKKEANLK